MKNISFLLTLGLVCFISCKTIKPVASIKPTPTGVTVPVSEAAAPEVNFSDQATWLLGYFSPAQLTTEPHSAWYIKGYDDYQVNSDAVNKLLEISKDNLSVKIVLGTWCPDSRREVPRFMRVLDIWQFPAAKVTFIGVDRAKLSPVAEIGTLDIQRVPTFIIYRNNIEAGRIIEIPTTSLEQDMVNILTGGKSN